ncbi:M-phase inducer phosphatase 1-A, partial [Trichinella pseudospiralis]
LFENCKNFFVLLSSIITSEVMDEEPTLPCPTEQWIFGNCLKNDQLPEVEASTDNELPVQNGNQHSPVTELAQHLAEHSLKLTPQKSLLSMDTAAYSPFPSTSENLITESALMNSNDNFQLVLDSNEKMLCLSVLAVLLCLWFHNVLLITDIVLIRLWRTDIDPPWPDQAAVSWFNFQLTPTPGVKLIDIGQYTCMYRDIGGAGQGRKAFNFFPFYACTQFFHFASSFTDGDRHSPQTREDTRRTQTTSNEQLLSLADVAVMLGLRVSQSRANVQKLHSQSKYPPLPPIKTVPRCVLLPEMSVKKPSGAESSAGSLSCLDGDDLRSPMILSPAPSSVFMDEDTQDSGFGEGQAAVKGPSQFNLPAVSTQSNTLHARFRSRSCDVKANTDEGFDDDFVKEQEAPADLKCHFKSLLSGSLQSEGDENISPNENSFRIGQRKLFKIAEENDTPFSIRQRKRVAFQELASENVTNQTPQLKRRKSLLEISQNCKRHPFARCYSEADVGSAFQEGCDNRNFIGDYSTTHALPLLQAPRVPDLCSIDGRILVKLLNEEYSHIIEKYIILDCRYPYEYNGGHIKGAVNVYTQEQLKRFFFHERNSETMKSSTESRQVVIFYCEFSQERGPRMSRYLRKFDRKVNSKRYPHLHYPEIYLLDGGYKNFFPNFKNYCEPPNYVPMLHEAHTADLRKFRAKSRSWSSDIHLENSFNNRRPSRQISLNF